MQNKTAPECRGRVARKWRGGVHDDASIVFRFLGAHAPSASSITAAWRQIRGRAVSDRAGGCSRVIALTAMVAGLSMTAQAAEPETLTLACQGTRTITTKPEPISMGIIVNFTKNTVHGFGSPGLMDVKITGVNEVTVTFGGSQDNRSSVASIRGIIDRVTGDVDAMSTVRDQQTSMIITSTSYELKCSPTQRKF
jgi:hypothetical protein